MKTVKYMVFRNMTHADMFNIYKPSGMEEGGGGQSYIDFPTAGVSVATWTTFFTGGRSVVLSWRAKGPSWTFPVNSIGGFGSQSLTVFQRRQQTVCIAAQKILSRRANRVRAWLPANGFPAPENPTDRINQPSGVVIFIVRTIDDEYWAGWFQNNSPCQTEEAEYALEDMLATKGVEGHAGFFDCTDYELILDETNASQPFLTAAARVVRTGPETHRTRTVGTRDGRTTGLRSRSESRAPRPGSSSEWKFKTEEELTDELFNNDEGASTLDEETKTRIQKVRVRNTKAARILKLLYKGVCQISGDTYSFQKKDGKPYCEAHHLIPLGAAGDDSPHNIIIVSPLIHMMLHYADVQGIDLGRVSESNTLNITINGRDYTIQWQPKHAEIIRKSQET